MCIIAELVNVLTGFEYAIVLKTAILGMLAILAAVLVVV
jgi:hypothetical protein